MIPKGAARAALRAALSGRKDGLSSFGCLSERLANHLLFQSNRLRAEYRFTRPPVKPAVGWTDDLTGRLVYDFGANHGRNIPYYLARGLNVVAIEANPVLCATLKKKYSIDIESRRVTVVNVCVTPEEAGDVTFYVHRLNDLLSTFVPPEFDTNGAFDPIAVKSETPQALFDRHGRPFYVKIDLEGLDGPIIRSVAQATRPVYMSAEAHSHEVLVELLRLGYQRFKVVEGSFSHERYYEVQIEGRPWRFEPHSAGPFGEDIPGPWLNAEETMSYLVRSGYGYGWRDLHARCDDDRPASAG